MKDIYHTKLEDLRNKQFTWLVTGCAGFIGSNLVEALLNLNQKVIGVDNFETGHQKNLEEVKEITSPDAWKKFIFLEGDITDFHFCKEVCNGVNFVLHQAALGSVPRSIANPLKTNLSNISGHLNMLFSAKESNVDSFVYAASSSTYGDHPGLPKHEDVIGKPLSPYAVSKLTNELYADVFSRVYDFNSIGLRYFNVYGKRQDPNGAYAAVIPKWINAMLEDKEVFINGDGTTSRDFCFIENVVQANILAAVASDDSKNKVYNVAVGGRTSLNDLFAIIKDSLKKNNVDITHEPKYRDFRIGDVQHSQASIKKAVEYLGYNPKFTVHEGIPKTVQWFIDLRNKNSNIV